MGVAFQVWREPCPGELSSPIELNSDLSTGLLPSTVEVSLLQALPHTENSAEERQQGSYCDRKQLPRRYLQNHSPQNHLPQPRYRRDPKSARALVVEKLLGRNLYQTAFSTIDNDQSVYGK